MNIKLTVFFEDPFWVGVFEREEQDFLTTARVVFGAEPRDYEVYALILNSYHRVRFGEPVALESSQDNVRKYKKKQKRVASEVKQSGIGTKAQRAMQLTLESNKLERKKKSKEETEKAKELKYLQKQQKLKEKRKGH